MEIQELLRTVASKDEQRMWMEYIPAMHIEGERNYVALIRRCHMALLRDLQPLVQSDQAKEQLRKVTGWLESVNGQFIKRWLEHDMILRMSFMVVAEQAKG